MLKIEKSTTIDIDEVYLQRVDSLVITVEDLFFTMLA